MTEKIDGTNVRIFYERSIHRNRLYDGERNRLYDGERVTFYGRTADAQMPTFLLTLLRTLFTPEKLAEVFPETKGVWLFGEGYGARIQKGGWTFPPDRDRSAGRAKAINR